MLNNDFPRILTLLRKERGLSQKKAAADLGISQALLSHYEKGIRECGLDFLIRAAAYYGVSCDYLLGRTPHPSGAVISPGSLPSEGAASGSGGGHSAAEYQRRVLVNSLNIVFGILKKINSEGVTRHVCAYLSTALYKMFPAALLRPGEKSPGGLLPKPGAVRLSGQRPHAAFRGQGPLSAGRLRLGGTPPAWLRILSLPSARKSCKRSFPCLPPLCWSWCKTPSSPSPGKSPAERPSLLPRGGRAVFCP